MDHITFDLSIFGDSPREQLEGARLNIGMTVFYNQEEWTITQAEIHQRIVYYKLESDDRRIFVPCDDFKDC